MKEQFIQEVRQYIRNRGFASAMEIQNAIIAQDKYLEAHDDIIDTLSEIACDDIHHVEYCNTATVGYRVKDLWFYNPRTNPMPLRT